jgi:hypothetical protein
MEKLKNRVSTFEGRTFFWTFIFVHFQKNLSTFLHFFQKSQNRREGPVILDFYFKNKTS